MLEVDAMLPELEVDGVVESDESVDRERVESAEPVLEPDPGRYVLDEEEEGEVELELEEEDGELDEL